MGESFGSPFFIVTVTEIGFARSSCWPGVRSDDLVFWFYRARHGLRLGDYSRLAGVMMFRSLFAYFNLFIVTVYLIIFPSFSYANPLLAIPWLMGEGGAAVMSQVAVGAAGIGIAVAVAKPSNGDPSEICLHPSCVTAPSGWPSDPSTGLPSAPPTSTPSTSSSGANPIYLNDPVSYCAARDLPTKPVTVGAATLNGAFRTTITCGDVVTYLGEPFTSSPCPSGYSLTSGTCTLSDSTVVRKPIGMACQIIRTGSSFGFDKSNPSCDSASNAGQLCNSDGTCTYISGDDLNVVPAGYVPGKTGQDHTVIAPVGSGGRISVMTVTGSGTSKQKTQTTTIDMVSGQPTVIQQQISEGDITPTSTGGTGASTGSGTGATSPSQDITCETVGTCGVALDGTLKNVGAKVDGIQTSFSDFIKNFTTVVQVPRLYTPSTDTAQSALSDFSSSIKNTALVSSVTGFFDVSLAGGSCPTWTIPVVNIMGLSIGGIEIDQFCTPTAYKVYSIASIVILVVCGFFAFRVAVDN